jgi:hypothetical protein
MGIDVVACIGEIEAPADQDLVSQDKALRARVR